MPPFLLSFAKARLVVPVAAVLAGLGGCLLAAPVAGAAEFVWSGQAATANWSLASNWAGFAPGGTVRALDFPALTGAACTANPQTPTCYASANDQTGLAADAISIDDGAGYDITGKAITVGAGGITAAPSMGDPAAPNDQPSTLELPITLAAPQTWSVTGASPNQQLLALGTVSGASNPLGIALQSDATLTLSDAEVGPVTIVGDGRTSNVTLKLGYFDSTGALVPGSLNATDQNPVMVTNGAALSTLEGTTGPLGATDGQLQVGQLYHAGTLTATGSVTLDPQSALFAFINAPGTDPGSDYSELASAGGTVDLGGATLALEDGEVPGSNACEVLNQGDVITLVSAPAGLTGQFNATPDGATVPLGCQGSDATTPTVTIHYTATAVTATVLNAGTAAAPTTTTLATTPSSPTTDESVTLTATVSAGGDASPAGTVEFDADLGGTTAPIAGCEAQQLIFSGPTYTATCQTSFAASQSPILSAIFSPADGSNGAGSSSSGLTLNVSPAPTTTMITLSPTTVGPAQPATMTAIVTPSQSGSTNLAGTVTFLLDGNPVPPGSGGTGCTNVPLVAGSPSPTAQCSLQFANPVGTSAHTITATYSGDANFAASTSTPEMLTSVGRKPVTSKICQAHVGRASISVIMVDVVVTCQGSSGQQAIVSLKLSARERVKAKKTMRTVLVGTSTLTLAAGQGETAHIVLNAAATRTLLAVRTLPVALTATQKTTTGTARLSTQQLTFQSYCASTWAKLKICQSRKRA